MNLPIPTKRIHGVLCLLGLLVGGCGSISPPQKAEAEADETPGAQILRISSFSPASGNLSSVPTTVVITFNEPINNIQGRDVTNYAMVCANTTLQFASTADATAGTVTVTFPVITVSSGVLCSLLVAPGIQNSAGTVLRGVRQADYTILGP